MLHVSHGSVVDAMLGWKEARIGAMMVALRAETIPEMYKTDNPYYGRVSKETWVNGTINWIYENAVNAQRLREGKEADFEAFPRPWGTRIQGTPLVEYKGGYYLEVKVKTRVEVYLLDGEEISSDLIEPWLKKRSKGRQGLDKPVILRDYTIENVTSITWGGETYMLEAA